MPLKLKTSNALDVWIGHGSWYTGHSTNMEMFYDFVNQYQKDHGSSINEIGLREEIEQRLEKDGGGVTEPLREIIRARISLALDILYFLERTGR